MGAWALPQGWISRGNEELGPRLEKSGSTLVAQFHRGRRSKTFPKMMRMGMALKLGLITSHVYLVIEIHP